MGKTKDKTLEDKCDKYPIVQSYKINRPDVRIPAYSDMGCYECEGLNKSCPGYTQKNKDK